MKNVFRVFGIIAAVVIIAFTAAACNNSGDSGDDPNNPYNNYDSKKITLQSLPENGACILMVSKNPGDNAEVFKEGVFAIGYADVSGNSGTFSLSAGTADGGQSANAYRGTGDFYISLSYEGGPHFVSKTTIRIDSETKDLQFAQSDWKDIALEDPTDPDNPDPDDPDPDDPGPNEDQTDAEKFIGLWERNRTGSLSRSTLQVVQGGDWQVHQSYPDLTPGDAKGTSKIIDAANKIFEVTITHIYMAPAGWTPIAEVPDEFTQGKLVSTTVNYQTSDSSLVFSNQSAGGIIDDIDGTYAKIDTARGSDKASYTGSWVGSYTDETNTTRTLTLHVKEDDTFVFVGVSWPPSEGNYKVRDSAIVLTCTTNPPPPPQPSTFSGLLSGNNLILSGIPLKKSDNNSVIGIWTKTWDEVPEHGEDFEKATLTVNADKTYYIFLDDTPYIGWSEDGNTETASWDENVFRFIYDYENPPIPVTIPYSLSGDGQKLTLSGENVLLMGGTNPWSRVK